jgi:lipoprotein-releasing system permease protein
VAIAEELPIRKNDSVLRLKQRYPEIKNIQAFATKSAILKTADAIEAVLFKGVEKDYDFNHINPFLVEGRWINFSDSNYSSEINLSASIARELKLKTGDKILIYFIQAGGQPPRARKLTVVGIFKTGIEEYDKLYALGDIRLIQKLNNWDDAQIGGYEVYIDDYRKASALSNDMVTYLPIGETANTMEEVYPNIFDWLSLQNKTIVIVIIIMTIIALLNLITCLLILVLERTRMVGILKAVGARSFTIQKIFLYHGSVIMLTGLFFGNLLGVGIGWLQQQYGFIKLPEEAYYISQAAVSFNWWAILGINAITFIVCFLVLLIPSLIVRRIQPVKAIQFR